MVGGRPFFFTVIVRVDHHSQISLGEMISYLPLHGGHIKLAERFVNSAFSFVREFCDVFVRLNTNIRFQALGWDFWFVWTITLPAELSAAAVLIDFWDKKTSMNSAWVTICLLVVVAINFMGAGKSHKSYLLRNATMNGSRCIWRGRVYLCINQGSHHHRYGYLSAVPRYPHAQEHLGLIILGLILDLGGGPDHDRLGFRYWKRPGPFVQYEGIPGAKGRFLSFWAVLTQAAFSFIGTENVTVSPSA